MMVELKRISTALGLLAALSTSAAARAYPQSEPSNRRLGCQHAPSKPRSGRVSDRDPG